jgi:hypothetical protein
MKKLYAAFRNENVQMAIIIVSVFLITGLVTLYAIFN